MRDDVVIVSDDDTWLVVHELDAYASEKYNWHIIPEHDIQLCSAWLETYYYRHREEAKERLSKWMSDTLDQALMKNLIDADVVLRKYMET